MAFVPPKDRVLEQSSSNSQTVFTVTGALDAGYNAFSASMGIGDTTLGAVVEPGVAFKAGLLTYSNTNEVTVTAIDSKGSFSAGGVKQVFMGMPAAPAAVRAIAGLAKKNYLLNGAMMVSQENGTTVGTATGYYPVDQFAINFQGTTGTLSAAQVASATPAGSPNRLRITVTTADASLGASDLIWLDQKIEGLRATDLLYGAASAKTITIQFGVKAPAGTYCVAIVNSAQNRSYVAEYTVSAGEANTDVVKSVTIPGDVTGTWLKDTGIGLWIRWGLMCGSTFQQAAGSWAATNVFGSSNQFNLMGTNGNVFELFDVGLYEGGIAPPFAVPDYADELLKCLRHYYKGLWTFRCSAVAAGIYTIDIPFKVPMRAIPTLSLSGTSRSNVAAVNFVNSDVNQTAYQITATAAADTYVYGETLVANARL